MSKSASNFRQFINDMSPSIDDWLKENDTEDHPFFDSRYNLNDNLKKHKLYRKLLRLYKIQDIFTGRSILHVGAATGALNFVLRHANPQKLIVLEPNTDNFEFLKKSKNIVYDDYIQAYLEDLPNLNRTDYDLIFLGNLPVADWQETMKLLTSLPNVVDIVIQCVLFNYEYPNTKYFLNPSDDYSKKSLERYYLWNGKLDKEYWSIGEIIKVAAQNNFVVTRKCYRQNNKNPLGWCDLIFSKLD